MFVARCHRNSETTSEMVVEEGSDPSPSSEGAQDDPPPREQQREEAPPEEAEVSNNEETSTQLSPAPVVKNDPIQRPVSVRLETTIRMTLASFVGYCIAYADWPNAIPPSQQWLIGFLTSATALRIPTLAATFLGMVLVMYTVLMFSLGSTTALLTAATVSDGLFVGMSALWALWISGLRYGAGGKVTGIFPSVLVSSFGLIGLGLHRLVRDGVEIVVSKELIADILGVDIGPIISQVLEGGVLRELQDGGNGFDLPSIADPGVLERLGSLLQSIEEYIEVIKAAIASLISSTQEGVELLQQFATEGIPIELESGPFEGRSITVGLTDDRDLSISIEGGTWLVRRLWTWSGLDNPLAVFQNFIIVASWSFLCVYISPLLPPVRTTRFATSGLLIPQTLRDAAWYVGRRWDTTNDKEGKIRDEEEDKVRKRLVGSVNILHGGTVAVGSAFEPRLLDYRCQIPRCTWMSLKSLAEATEWAALKALMLDQAPPVTESLVVRENTISTYEQCAKSLETREHFEGKDSHKDETNEEEGALSSSEDDPLLYRDSTKDLVDAKVAWLESLHPEDSSGLTFKDGFANILKNILPWFGPSLVFLTRLVEIPMEPFLCLAGKRRFDLGKAAHYVKFAVGFTALICMSVYWDAYRDFEIRVTDSESEIEGVNLERGDPPDSYSGWHLLAYAFATMPTTEGTAKKCVLRLLGTFVGAFSAWAAIRATGDNEIGMVSWLTVTTFCAVYLSVDKDEKARLGQSKDFGYGGFYFVLTQSVIVFEFVAEIGEGDDLVVNRIASNATGVLMAALLAVIPPTVMGGDPKWTKLMLDEIKGGLEQCILLITDNKDKEDAVNLKATYVKQVNALRSDASYLLEDASRLSSFPVYRVDPMLEEELTSMTVTSSFVAFVLDRASDLVKAKSLDEKPLEKGTELHERLEQVLKRLQEIAPDSQKEIAPDSQKEMNSKVLAGSDPETLFVEGVEILEERIRRHEANLLSIGK